MAVEMERDESSGQAGPESALEALKAFKEAQGRRVAHWKEYDEALEHYERTNLNASDDHHTAHNDGQGHADHQGAQMSSHYHTTSLPMTDDIFSKILALVTSGLLDCSHSVRTVETELRTTFARQDLAVLVGNVQEKENAVLRSIVRRDQNKRIAKVEGRDMSGAIAHANNEIDSLRANIQDLMSEVNAEMAEL